MIKINRPINPIFRTLVVGDSKRIWSP